MAGRSGNRSPRSFPGSVWSLVFGLAGRFCRIPRRRAGKCSSVAVHAWTGRPTQGKLEIKRKRAARMNAPPLKGSDTSVSSPKRQTAEAVRRKASREHRVESSLFLHGRYPQSAKNQPQRPLYPAPDETNRPFGLNGRNHRPYRWIPSGHTSRAITLAYRSVPGRNDRDAHFPSDR